MFKTDRVLSGSEQIAGFILKLHLRTIWVCEFILGLHFGPGTKAKFFDSFDQKFRFLQRCECITVTNRIRPNSQVHTASDQGVLPLGPLEVWAAGMGFALGFAGVIRLPFGCHDGALGTSASSSSLKATRVEAA
jgi:hypothetical protein